MCMHVFVHVHFNGMLSPLTGDLVVASRKPVANNKNNSEVVTLLLNIMNILCHLFVEVA